MFFLKRFNILQEFSLIFDTYEVNINKYIYIIKVSDETHDTRRRGPLPRGSNLVNLSCHTNVYINIFFLFFIIHEIYTRQRASVQCSGSFFSSPLFSRSIFFLFSLNLFFMFINAFYVYIPNARFFILG